ncbi:transcription repressor NadR [Halobacillus yeomjeoni]|uniref:Transcription repressor NadR n=1 Tax=Halobacillus yeomjeoni TaxID=311194 RepID=A0A931HWH4_9BACI|nr:transcription repressor NadR [Halobacillus yeomjeoni]MBH0230471.1 transcription repressor NadR [Halobacillus yeomjeoni]MCA0985357.1 transcription repressor NadR [Halobacillus yeomjeoni]
MSESSKKMKAHERREYILTLLKQRGVPVTGSSLAEEMNVTRQVIVGDVSLLKARNEPIVATSQGYMYMTDAKEDLAFKKTIVCQHGSDETEEELHILVDHGVVVQDVVVEHPIYGDLTAQLRIANRRDVKKFMEQMRSTSASFLLELTDGIHTHTIAADSEAALKEAEEALLESGILMKTS